eukprot:11213680-Lingulodinium_polyedra.AAC.1
MGKGRPVPPPPQHEPPLAMTNVPPPKDPPPLKKAEPCRAGEPRKPADGPVGSQPPKQAAGATAGAAGPPK